MVVRDFEVLATIEGPEGPLALYAAARVAANSVVHFATGTGRFGEPYTALCKRVKNLGHMRPAPRDSAFRCRDCLRALRSLVRKGRMAPQDWLGEEKKAGPQPAPKGRLPGKRTPATGLPQKRKRRVKSE